MKKKLLSLIAFALALVMAMTSLPVGAANVSANEDKREVYTQRDDKEQPGTRTQSHYQNFSSNYTLTGNGASDIVAVALA